MGIRDILVHLDNSASSPHRLDVAISYAVKHGARLRGLYLITHSYYEPRALDEKTECEKIENMFIDKTQEAGILAEWVFQDSSVMGSNVSDLITMHAYFTDLIILGQANLSAPAAHIPIDLVERVTLMCGRPVLVVPYTGIFNNSGTRMLIAWKAGRESIRVINDSIPILRKAHSVAITEIGTTNMGQSQSLDNVSKFLDKHSINGSIEIINAGSFPIGDTLLNNVCEKKIDLLVMGAFAPNRRGTLELSPVAKHILKHLTVPVLISH